MAVKQLKNYFVKPQTKLDYSRSVFKYERTHSTNLLTGRIVPVAVVNCMPGDTVPNRFGFNLDSAPLISPSLDNVYIDIISVWCPHRLVMADFNEWLGDNDTYAWTLGNNVSLPKITQLYTKKKPMSGYTLTRSYTYYAEKYLAPHIGLRFFNEGRTDSSATFPNWIETHEYFGSESRFHNGFQVIPARQYVYIWNELFRNQNIQAPILFSKQSGTDLSLDLKFYDGFGELLKANRLKDIFNMARLGPSIQTVSIGSELGNVLPIITGTSRDISGVPMTFAASSGTALNSGRYKLWLDGSNGQVYTDASDSTLSGNFNVVPNNLYADLSALTVNNLYYSIMLQKYMNKASSGRRPVEFYKTFFGLSDSDALYDMPELLSQKRYQVNISRVVATANSTNADTSKDQGLGTQGAFSHTAVGGTLFPSFTASEYGMLWVFAVIRTQESYSSGADRYLSDGELLDTYLPVFDHIGEDYVELNELANMWTTNSEIVFGYQEAWYHYRYQVSDAVGSLAPGQPLEYWTLARDFDASGMAFTVNTNFIAQGIKEFDRMLQLPVTTSSGSGVDSEGILYVSDRYQWIIQFALVGDFARTMSKDSEPLLFGRL